jgi:hypothetical protein
MNDRSRFIKNAIDDVVRFVREKGYRATESKYAVYNTWAKNSSYGGFTADEVAQFLEVIETVQSYNK